MKDYREVIERLSTIRGFKSSHEWIVDIVRLECVVAESEFVEKSPYLALNALKKELVSVKGTVSHKFIRKFINKQIETYDECYIGNVGQLLSYIEYSCIDNCENQNDCKFLKDVREYINF